WRLWRIAALAAMIAIYTATAFPVVAQAEPLSNAGEEFWLGFPTNYAGAAADTLYITGNTATTGTVSIPGESFSEGFSITPGTVTSVKLPAGSEMAAGVSDGIEEKGIHITAGAPVVIYGLDDYSFTTDAYTALPTDVIGTSYTVLAFGAGEHSEFSVVAGQSNTTVTITPSVDGGEGDTRPAGVPYTVTLGAGQEYQLQASTNPEDLTGTKITSSAPVSVFGGEQCAGIPSDAFSFCDYVVEQDFPDDAWGTSFLTEPLKTRSHGDDFEVAADQNETHVKLNGTLVTTLNAGEHYSQEVEGASEWSSDKPIELAQYANSTSYDEATGDPSMMSIPPYQQFETGYTITTPINSETVFTNYVNLVAPDDAVGAIKIDGTAVPASEFHPIGSSGFEGAQVDVEPGSHVLAGNGQPFGAFVYGFSEANAYSYAGGFSLAPIATVGHVTLTVPTEAATVGTEHCLTATITDEEGAPAPGVRVDFLVTGANSAGGSVFANGAGEAQFCYTGAHAGEDTITASVGLVSAIAHKTWQEPQAPPKSPTPAPKGEVLAFKLPPPVLGKTVNVEPVSGKVFVALPAGAASARVSLAFSPEAATESLSKGLRFIPLVEARQVPVGSILETTAGVARITTATAKQGKVQSGEFGAGIFKLLQNRKQKGLTELSIIDSHSARQACSTLGKAATAAKRLSSKTLGRLSSSASGKFTTRGQYSAATVRGTVWSVSNRCDGTFTKVTRGVVSVRDFRRRKTITLHTGQSYLAKA
ncbi:MAG TPA: Ig-like domain-containing protein, partial [Solirubrobacteraceae bacterium]|nr:Ig-like domain-containing protein [Solirubrobacteraceae bacterium]